jgi:hypothetical protein
MIFVLWLKLEPESLNKGPERMEDIEATHQCHKSLKRDLNSVPRIPLSEEAAFAPIVSSFRAIGRQTRKGLTRMIFAPFQRATLSNVNE